jgi:hypothetical protein
VGQLHVCGAPDGTKLLSLPPRKKRVRGPATLGGPAGQPERLLHDNELEAVTGGVMLDGPETVPVPHTPQQYKPLLAYWVR